MFFLLFLTSSTKKDVEVEGKVLKAKHLLILIMTNISVVYKSDSKVLLRA